LEFRIKEARNIIPKCTFPENCYTDSTQLTHLVYTAKKHRFHYRNIIIILSVGALIFYHTIISLNLLKLQKELFLLAFHCIEKSVMYGMPHLACFLVW